MNARIRRCVLMLCVPLLMLVPASVAASDGSSQDSVTGGAQAFPGTPFELVRGVAAHSGPLGEDPHGHVQVARSLLGRIGGHVTCLNVVGNTAAIVSEIDQAENPALIGQFVILFIVDNGEPVNGQAVDLFMASVVPTPPTVCPAPISTGFPIDSGNYVVRDAQPI
jgi:hypothetical protein